MKPILTIAVLTWKAAFRFRLFLVLALLLLAAVVGLPLLIKDDGTARGFTQILLTYTLSSITGLLGLSTLWLACGTLARDIEEGPMQMVVVKPIARWQIWIGKWMGLMSLNAALVLLSGLGVFATLQWRAARLPAAEQQKLRNEVLVARASARPPSLAAEITQETDAQLQAAREKNPHLTRPEVAQLREQIRQNLLAYIQNVPPGYQQSWKIDLGYARNFLHGQPLYLRIKFNTSEQNVSQTFPVLWQVGVPQETPLWQTAEPMSLAPDTFHEFEIPSDLFDSHGILTVTVINPNNIALLFTTTEGIEVLYRDGNFALNFARGLGIIFCWLALLAALGLTMASFLSFPVAAFAACAALVVVFSSGILKNAVAEGTFMTYNQETGERGSPLDPVVIPIFQGILTVINLARDFSPIDQLSAGRSITWLELCRAVLQIIFVLGGILAACGIWAFTRRELAAAQPQS
ncbi:MAG TPA: hypothetical protein PKN95_04005 [Verrucomicrobiota bacterium]|nr:hypothetical protein [Verrucomicrobiota bacterium]HNT13629.1 hypothetical protein [Verrucomicrobiota bacterium]